MLASVMYSSMERSRRVTGYTSASDFNVNIDKSRLVHRSAFVSRSHCRRDTRWQHTFDEVKVASGLLTEPLLKLFAERGGGAVDDVDGAECRLVHVRTVGYEGDQWRHQVQVGRLEATYT